MGKKQLGGDVLKGELLSIPHRSKQKGHDLKVIIETLPDELLLTIQVTETLSVHPAVVLFLALDGENSANGVHKLQCDDKAGIRAYRLSGPFCSDMATALITRVARGVAAASGVHFEKDGTSSAKSNSPELTLDILLDGQNIPTLSALEGSFGTMPDRAYALGSFELSQPELLISDPRYKPGTWCAGTVKARPGNWVCEVIIGPTSWFTRVKLLRARHESVTDEVYGLDFTDSGIDVGVDSGQCGLFDAEKYEKDAFVDSAYEKLCDITLGSELSGGIIPGRSGVVCLSGFGDGSYSALVHRNADGEAIGIQLVFISDEAIEDSDLEDDQEEELENTGS